MAEIKDTHRNRILNNVLRKNLFGGVFLGKSAIPSQISQFDVTADVNVNNIDELHSEIMMGYGDIAYTFTLTFAKREHEDEKTHAKYIDYLVTSIE